MKEISNYDFSGKRVKYCGKCMDKFSLAYHIDFLKLFLYRTILLDVFSYADLADELRYYLFLKAC